MVYPKEQPTSNLILKHMKLEQIDKTYIEIVFQGFSKQDCQRLEQTESIMRARKYIFQ